MIANVLIGGLVSTVDELRSFLSLLYLALSLSDCLGCPRREDRAARLRALAIFGAFCLLMNPYTSLARLLREEWGFTGMVVTDNAAVVPEWITLAKAIYGGTDLMLVYNTAKLPSAISETDAGITALKTSAHHILWTISDAAARRGTEATQGFDGYKALRIGINVVGFVGGAALIAAYFLKGKKGKEAEAVEA